MTQLYKWHIDRLIHCCTAHPCAQQTDTFTDNATYRDVKIIFFWYSILGTKVRFFSTIVYQPTQKLVQTGVKYGWWVRLCAVNALTFRWWSRLLLSLAILSSCICSSSGAFLQQPLFGAYKLWRAEQSPGVSWINDCCDDLQALISYGETKQTSKGIPPPSACFTRRVRLLLIIIITLGIDGDTQTDISHSPIRQCSEWLLTDIW